MNRKEIIKKAPAETFGVSEKRGKIRTAARNFLSMLRPPKTTKEGKKDFKSFLFTSDFAIIIVCGLLGASVPGILF
jgi:hypothetical protein